MVERFRHATRTQYSQGVPPSFATRFRKAEFEFLDRFEVDMRELLHVDQEYEYFVPLTVGDALEVTTQIADMKDRRGMYFVVLRTDIVSNQVKKIASHTTFVVRPKK